MKKNHEKENYDYLMKQIFNLTNEALVLVDRHGYIIHISDAYCDVLEIKKEKAVGKHITKVIENTRLHTVMETKKSEIGELQMVNGKPLIVSRIPVIKDGEVLGCFGRVLYRDINELKDLYGKLDKAKSTMNFYKNLYETTSKSKYTLDDVIGSTSKINELKKVVRTIGPKDSNVLIYGESGTGKEIFAHSIHDSSERKNKPIICINCGSIAAGLVESELFGYEEGSFTGAIKGGKIGLVEAANHGTLFLDEIADLPLEMQVKILRLLQEHEIKRVGGNAKISVDVRIIAATNKDLEKLVKEENFREDLFYRLDVIRLIIPPLRERKEDIGELTEFFIGKLNKQRNSDIVGISPHALNYLKAYDWPGNVRELENVLEQIFNFMGSKKIIKAENLPYKITRIDYTNKIVPLKDTMDATEKESIISALLQNKSNKTKTAKDLGLSRTSLYEKLDKHKIKV